MDPVDHRKQRRAGQVRSSRTIAWVHANISEGKQSKGESTVRVGVREAVRLNSKYGKKQQVKQTLHVCYSISSIYISFLYFFSNKETSVWFVQPPLPCVSDPQFQILTLQSDLEFRACCSLAVTSIA